MKWFFLDELPKKALSVGGGYIAVEFRGYFKTDSVLIPHWASSWRPIARGLPTKMFEAFASEEYKKSGIDVRLNTDVERNRIGRCGEQKWRAHCHFKGRTLLKDLV